MSTSQTTWLAKPTDSEPVPHATQGYFRARNQQRVHSLLLEEFEQSGLTQAELARRARKRTDVICRLLGEPSNLTLDTISDLVFAMRGGEPEYSIDYPLDAPKRNRSQPTWLSPAPLQIGVPESATGSGKAIVYG